VGKRTERFLSAYDRQGNDDLREQQMNTVTATELKRRGLAVIEERLRVGPVHLVKRNRAAAVVLSMAEYSELLQSKPAPGPPRLSAIQWLIRQRPIGSKSKRQLARELRAERKSWG